MLRAHGNAHKTKTEENFPDAALVIFNAEFPFDNIAQINAPPPDQRSFRPPQNKLFEPLFLFRRQAAPGMPFGEIPQPFNALGVVADDPVPQRLPRHPHLPGRAVPIHAVQDIGNPEHTRRNTTAVFLTRLLPQHHRADVPPHRKP
jgi:hypothetical protein